MQKIRRERGKSLLREMNDVYGPALARSRIHFALDPRGITFRETSTTGKVFAVVVRNGRVVRSNLAPYAKVF